MKKETIKFEFPRSSTIETVINVIVSKKFASNSSSINYSLLLASTLPKWDDTRRRESIFHPSNPSDRKSICFVDVNPKFVRTQQ